MTDPSPLILHTIIQPLKGVPQRDPSAPCGARDSRTRHPTQVLLHSTPPPANTSFFSISYLIFSSLLYSVLFLSLFSILLSSLFSLLPHLCTFLLHLDSYSYRILYSSSICFLSFTSHVNCEVAVRDTYHITHIAQRTYSVSACRQIKPFYEYAKT